MKLLRSGRVAAASLLLLLIAMLQPYDLEGTRNLAHGHRHRWVISVSARFVTVAEMNPGRSWQINPQWVPPVLMVLPVFWLVEGWGRLGRRFRRSK